ncbi:dihydrofolate reductase family protein [Hymenobacter volaticus]|uniref:Dihydrofolate reductase family protein n=1 Tax=Hymenobacter volaticus TaxID=2932254 RepID=A0ABY4G4N0_9BACT|nr:dihydrofolate reductase family protein [Hymenobacter volaticus]UOQ65843.1 dihydrofolate reductase family protein [Hymenobacter volaticus]
MRKVIAAIYLSLDGVMESPTWTVPYWDEDLARLQRDLNFASDALLLGRVTYEGFAAAWPGMKDEEGFADRMNSLPKFVASRTLKTEEWNASILQGNVAQEVAQEVAQLKQQPGENILLYGSAELVRYLLQHNLIDEYRLMVHPVVVGSGKRLFQDGAQADMQLLDTKTTSTGVVVLTYQLAQADSQAE